jgi:hypothetical protein
MLKLGLSQNALQVQSHFWHSALGCSVLYGAGGGAREARTHGRSNGRCQARLGIVARVPILPAIRRAELRAGAEGFDERGAPRRRATGIIPQSAMHARTGG